MSKSESPATLAARRALKTSDRLDGQVVYKTSLLQSFPQALIGSNLGLHRREAEGDGVGGGP